MATNSSPSKSNNKHAGVKRILREAKELQDEPSTEFHAAPLDSDLFEWHFSVRVPHAEFEGGIYHGRILLPTEYPLRPPEIMLLTPNGRFELNRKICLTITGFHEEAWQPAWGIRTALLGLIAFFATEAKGAIGGLDTPAAERRKLAKVSGDWTCPTCRLKNSELCPAPESISSTSAAIGAVPTDPIAEPETRTHSRAPSALASLESESIPPPSEAAERQPAAVDVATDPLLNFNPAAAVPPAPLWIDRLIGLLVVCIAALVVRKLGSNSTPVSGFHTDG